MWFVIVDRCLISKKRKDRLLNATNTRLANLERKTHEQFKHRHAGRCRARWWGGGGNTRKEDDEEELD
jgi:hypothetical protein